tara:strand:+ start:1390 stop:1788 length:399 start_codon:yes stop_codon:yes gene_type:complete
MIILPDDIIRHILEYNADYHPNLLKCHKELLKNRPCYYKRVVSSFRMDVENMRMFKINTDHLIYINILDEEPYIKLNLNAIEVSPVISGYPYTDFRNIVLYYGWTRETDSKLMRRVLGANNRIADIMSPGYY